MSTIGVLRQPQFRRVFLAQSVSTLGNNIAPIAVAFAVLDLRNSAVDLGLVLAARTLPMAIFMLVGGAWADRLPRKNVMVVSDLVCLVSQGAFALLLIGHAPAIWALMLIQAVNGAASAFFRPASSGLVQEAVPASDRQSANALLSAAQNTSSIAGPAIAAILIAFAGNAWALGIDAATFGISALFLARVVVAAREIPVRTGIGREIAEGFRAVIERRWLALQIASFAEFQLFILAAFSVIGPLISQKEYAGATTWAIVTSVTGVGALLGDAISLRYRPQRPLIASNLIGLLVVPLLIALAVGAPVWALVIGGLLFGVGMSVSNTLWFTVLQHNVPEHLMARVSAFDWMGSMVLRPIGLAVIAPIAAIVGAAPVLVVAGVATVATFGGLLFSSSVRQLRGANDETSPAA